MRIRVIIIIIIIGMLAGCQHEQLGGTTTTTTATKAPDFTLKDLSGSDVKLSSYQGKVVLLVFWATWCSPCVNEVPILKDYYTKFMGGPFIILAVNDKESQGTVQAFCTSKGIDYKALLDPAGSVFALYNVSAIPTNVLIDKAGNINKTLAGSSPTESEIQALF